MIPAATGFWLSHAVRTAFEQAMIEDQNECIRRIALLCCLSLAIFLRCDYFHLMTSIDLTKTIRTIPDFPKPGILFYDIATMLADGTAWREAVRQMAEKAGKYGPEYIAGIDARGFLFAGALAQHFGIGALMVRKKGKLPGDVIEHSYSLEYGSGTLEAQTGIFPPGARIVLVDDLLATGGTLAAACHLLQKLGGDVRAAITFIELDGLDGRKHLTVPYENILHYPM